MKTTPNALHRRMRLHLPPRWLAAVAAIQPTARAAGKESDDPSSEIRTGPSKVKSPRNTQTRTNGGPIAQAQAGHPGGGGRPPNPARRRRLRALGIYGGQSATPNLDKLAANGLRYGNFHHHGLCSPSRAPSWPANPHKIGLGSTR